MSNEVGILRDVSLPLLKYYIIFFALLYLSIKRAITHTLRTNQTICLSLRTRTDLKYDQDSEYTWISNGDVSQGKGIQD